MDAGFVFKVGQLFKPHYGVEGVDFIDQLNYQYTGGLMVIFIAVIGVRQIVGKPITCWVPKEFSSSWESYVENLCWVSNTYFLRNHEDIPISPEEKDRERTIVYYQWVAIVLAGQAMLSYAPQIIWKICSRRLPLLLKSAREASIPDHDLRRKAVSCLVAALEEQAESRIRYKQRVRGIFRYCLCGIGPGSQIAALFIVVRLIFIGNTAGQIYLMKHFLGSNDTLFGLKVFQDLYCGRDWHISGHFPRIAYCDFEIRRLSGNNPQTYTLQCVLPVNHFIEKIYIFLWFWFLIIGGLTTLNTLFWVFRLWVPNQRIAYIKQYLKALKAVSNTEERDCARFVNYNLGVDGVFILHVVSQISSDLIALDVTATLWRNYRQAKITGVEDDVNRLLGGGGHLSKDKDRDRDDRSGGGKSNRVQAAVV